MAEQVIARMGAREYLQLHSVKLAGLAVAGTALAARVHGETFNFSILDELTTALIALMPNISSLINEGAPVVIQFCVVAAVVGPFIWIAKKAGVL